jgi:DUF4097 and DUF4098 domain-containing protein YvlB
MKRAVLAAAGVCAGLLLTSCVDGVDAFGQSHHETVDVSRALTPNGAFSIENTNGSIHVATWDEPRVRIQAVKAAASERALERIEVVVEGEGDRVSVKTRHPRGHWLGARGKVDYTVTLPRQAQVSLHDVNGRVEVEDVGGRLRVDTVNGTIDATGIGGEVEASTVNGTVKVSLARVEPGSRNRLRATNGTVRVTLPRDASAEVEASTVNGAVGCDFELEGGSRSRRHLEGRLGGGGARFELQTVNGTAHIDRGLASVAATPRAPAAPSSGARPPKAEEEPAPSR